MYRYKKYSTSLPEDIKSIIKFLMKIEIFEYVKERLPHSMESCLDKPMTENKVALFFLSFTFKHFFY